MTRQIYHTIHELETTALVKAGISLRIGGVSQPPYAALNLATHVGDKPAAVVQNRQIFSEQTGIRTVKYCRQIHSTAVVADDTVTTPSWHLEEYNEPEISGDALITAQHGTPLGIFTADCVPIFILDVATPAIGIVHAGWRGTLARIADNTLEQMKTRFGTDTRQCRIHLGPAIQKCCYAVSPELLGQFAQHFGKNVHTGTHLSLQAANVNQLIERGVPASAISASPFCTACCTDKFYSYRAEGGQTGRMLSFIQLVEV